MQERRGPPPPSAVVAMLAALLSWRFARLVHAGEEAGPVPAVPLLAVAVVTCMVAAWLAYRAGPRPWRLVAFLASVAAGLLAWWAVG